MDDSLILLKLLIKFQEILCFISSHKLTLGATFINLLKVCIQAQNFDLKQTIS